MARKVFVGVVALVVVVLVFVARHQDKPAPVKAAPVSGEFTTVNLVDPGGVAETARQFVGLWAMPEPGDTAATWEARLHSLVTDDLARGLRSTDLSYLPRQKVSPASPPDIRALTTVDASIVVTLADGSQIAVTVVRASSGYAVSDVAGIGE
jgi:hypothetical protein